MSDIDDKLKSEALNWLTSLRGTAEKATDFAIEQAPDVLRELLMLGRIETTLQESISVAVALAGAYILWIATHKDFSVKATPDDPDGSKESTACFFIGLWIFAIGLLLSWVFFHGFASAWFAPRVYIVEHLSGLAGQAVGK